MAETGAGRAGAAVAWRCGARAAVIQTEPSYAARAQINKDAKRRFAAAAAGLVEAHQAIGSYTGSTVANLARALADRQAPEIVTASLQTILAMPHRSYPRFAPRRPVTAT